MNAGASLKLQYIYDLGKIVRDLPRHECWGLIEAPGT
jgi:hypothetical protein